MKSRLAGFHLGCPPGEKMSKKVRKRAARPPENRDGGVAKSMLKWKMRRMRRKMSFWPLPGPG